MSKLNQEQKDLLVGTLLGNANLHTSNKGQTWRFRVIHKTEHKPYLAHKYELMKEFCGSEPIENNVFDPRTSKTYDRWYFSTRVNNSFRYYGNSFYTWNPKTETMEKDVPKQIQQMLTPRAIAYWYMDEGALKWLGHSNAMRICTESFSLVGVNRLQKALRICYNIETTLTKKTVKGCLIGYRISIPEASSASFRELIRPYLIDCMKYKVSDGNRGYL